ncbi:MBL fold metallo-hydrolase [Marinoscillum sp.]|uniref:MBL fold metallo-hydrolase n=1 Tax=Marinoscillum sp. TaxID=2024838 RepID=UPI003BAB8A98
MTLLKSRPVKILAIVLSIIFLFIIGVMAFINFAPQFGAKPSGEHLQQISSSPNYGEDQFVNQIETIQDMSFSNMWAALKESISAKNTSPKEAFETYFGTEKPTPSDSNVVVTWYGHSAILLEIEGKRIFLDPMLGPHSSPVSFFGKRFKNKPPFDLDKLGQLDAVIFSHDHYDHLDYYTIKRIKEQVGHFYTPLGLGSHLQAWGVPASKITELDWWDSAQFGHFTFTATPARHFSGRGTGDRNKTQWASWVIEGHSNKIYFSGDSGYGPHFQEIGKRMGPFDFAFMECGQYNDKWANIHMMPEQTVQAALDLKAKKMMPIHWGGFSLAPHEWYDPADRVAKAAAAKSIELITPKIGKGFSLQQEDLPKGQWWEAYKPN